MYDKLPEVNYKLFEKTSRIAGSNDKRFRFSGSSAKNSNITLQ